MLQQPYIIGRGCQHCAFSTQAKILKLLWQLSQAATLDGLLTD